MAHFTQSLTAVSVMLERSEIEALIEHHRQAEDRASDKREHGDAEYHADRAEQLLAMLGK